MENFFEFKQRIRIINKNQKRSKRLPESKREYPQRDDQREREREREGSSLQWDYEREMLMEMDLYKDGNGSTMSCNKNGFGFCLDLSAQSDWYSVSSFKFQKLESLELLCRLLPLCL